MRRAVAPTDSETVPLTVPSGPGCDPIPAAETPRASECDGDSGYMARLTQAVGWRLVLITWVMYGLDQGGIESINDLGMIYFWKGRGLEPVCARSVRASVLSHLYKQIDASKHGVCLMDGLCVVTTKITGRDGTLRHLRGLGVEHQALFCGCDGDLPPAGTTLQAPHLVLGSTRNGGIFGGCHGGHNPSACAAG